VIPWLKSRAKLIKQRKEALELAEFAAKEWRQRERDQATEMERQRKRFNAVATFAQVRLCRRCQARRQILITDKPLIIPQELLCRENKI